MWKLLIKCGIWKNIRILKRSLMQYLRTLMVLWFYPSDEVLPWEIRLVIGIRVESWFNDTWQPWNLLWRWDLSFWLPLLHGQLIHLRRLVIFLSLQRHRLESLKAPNSWHFFSLKQRSKILMGKKKKKVTCVLTMAKKPMMKNQSSWNWQTHLPLAEQMHWRMEFSNRDSVNIRGHLPGDSSRDFLDRKKEATSSFIFPIFNSMEWEGKQGKKNMKLLSLDNFSSSFWGVFSWKSTSLWAYLGVKSNDNALAYVLLTNRAQKHLELSAFL